MPGDLLVRNRNPSCASLGASLGTAVARWGGSVGLAAKR